MYESQPHVFLLLLYTQYFFILCCFSEEVRCSSACTEILSTCCRAVLFCDPFFQSGCPPLSLSLLKGSCSAWQLEQKVLQAREPRQGGSSADFHWGVLDSSVCSAAQGSRLCWAGGAAQHWDFPCGICPAHSLKQSKMKVLENPEWLYLETSLKGNEIAFALTTLSDSCSSSTCHFLLLPCS